MTRFQESFGRDYVSGGDDDDYDYRVPTGGPYWNHVTHLWECSCRVWEVEGSCYHLLRFRSETVITVSEEYL